MKPIAISIVVAAALAGALIAALSCAQTATVDSPPAALPPPTPGEAAAVDLDQSFLIPPKDGKTASHTPCVVFTADGKRMLTATSESEIAVFEVATRKLLQRIRFPEEGTDGVSIDASGRYAAWALKKGGVAVIEIATEKIVARDPKLALKWLAVAPDAKTVAVSRGKELEVRDLATLALRKSLSGHEADITNLAWSPDGARLASTGEDGRLAVYEVQSGWKPLVIKKDEPLYAAAFHPRGFAIAFGGKDKKVYQYDFASEREEVISKDQPYWITCLGYSPDGERIAAGDESCDIWLYKVKTKELTFHSKHHVECWLNSVAWAPDNETFLFGCRPNSLAGKPALYEQLAWTEARRSQEVQGKQQALLRAVDAQIAKTADAEQKKTLEAYRQSLVGQPMAMQMGGLTGATFGLSEDSDIQIATAGVKLDSVTELGGLPAKPQAPTPPLPPELQQLAKEHDEALKKEVERLKSNTCVNQWKVKK